MSDESEPGASSEIVAGGFHLKFIGPELPERQHKTANRTLTKVELSKLFAPLFDDVLAALNQASNNDPELLFALRRKLSKELEYLERGKPMQRRAIKQRKLAEQKGLCAECSMPIADDEAELDRKRAIARYTMENTRLIHHACHRRLQRERGFA